MSMPFRIRFRQFVAWNIHIVVFLPISFTWLPSFYWSLCCLCCIWSLYLILLALFYVVFDLYQCYLQYSRVYSSFSWQCNLLYVRSEVLYWLFLFFDAFFEVLSSFTSRIVPSIIPREEPRWLILRLGFCYIVWFQVLSSFARNIFS